MASKKEIKINASSGFVRLKSTRDSLRKTLSFLINIPINIALERSLFGFSVYFFTKVKSQFY